VTEVGTGLDWTSDAQPSYFKLLNLELQRIFENIGHGLESSTQSGEQQLKRTQSGSSSSAQRVVWHWISRVGE